MSTFFWIMLASLGGSVLSAAAAGTYLLLPERVRDHTVTYLVSFAIGMLLGAGFLHLLPEALTQRSDNIQGLMATALLAILVFFLLEKGLVWRHHHHQEHDSGEACHEAPAGALILVGDAFHNFLDGVLIAASFTADFISGWSPRWPSSLMRSRRNSATSPSCCTVVIHRDVRLPSIC
jgi:zinc and cadmium transporter